MAAQVGDRNGGGWGAGGWGGISWKGSSDCEGGRLTSAAREAEEIDRPNFWAANSGTSKTCQNWDHSAIYFILFFSCQLNTF